MKTELVHISKNKPFTDSIVIAEAVGLKHRRVIALIRKHQSDLEEFGEVTFQTSLNKQGSATEYTNLTEDQATFLMMLFKPSPIVVKFRVQLVKAFRKALNDLDRLSKQKNEPAWRLERDDTKIGFKWMSGALEEQRQALGKETSSVHYMNEAKLVNGVYFGIFKGVDRDNLSKADIKAIGDLQRLNAGLITQNKPYDERKECLTNYLTSKMQPKQLNLEIPNAQQKKNTAQMMEAYARSIQTTTGWCYERANSNNHHRSATFSTQGTR